MTVFELELAALGIIAHLLWIIERTALLALACLLGFAGIFWLATRQWELAPEAKPLIITAALAATAMNVLRWRIHYCRKKNPW
jgi:hypothetical protein